MKKKYTKPEAECLKFRPESVLDASGIIDPGVGGGVGGGGSGDETEIISFKIPFPIR